VARHPYGYTGFHCDLTPYLKYGMENTVRVQVNNDSLPNSRWYSGSGIYRPVWLMEAESVHIAAYGVFIYTNDNKEATIETTIENHGNALGEYTLRSSIHTENKTPAASNEIIFTVNESKSVVCQSIPIPDPIIWSLENPYLYTLKTELLYGDTVMDSTETRFGVRNISVDSKNGFQLNGKTIKLKGACVHHDCGLLGAASYKRAEERKVELLKDSGFNAIRCAHNPPSPAFLDACDRLGMLVMDEAFDCWNEGKQAFDYNLYFESHWQKDMAAMILRDRNHPSIVMWSTGNEILERNGRSNGYALANQLAGYVRTLDSTRPVTNALCDLWNDDIKTDNENKTDDPWAVLTEKFAEPLDIVGYNYLLNRLEKDGIKYPNRVIAATETFPMEAFDGWDAVERLPHVIGDFVWTGLDYLGEAGIGHVWYNGEGTFCGGYPWNQAFCGDIDICGFKRPQSYYRDFVWGIGTVPYIAVYKPEFYGKEADISRWGWPDVVNSWSWPGFENKPVVIDVYSGGDEIELLLNNKSMGRKPAGKANKYLAKFETSYEPGSLTAVTYENGKEIYRSVLKTASKPAEIRLSADKDKLEAVWGDLSFVMVELLDKEGNMAHDAVNELYFTVSGAGSLIAVGNGNPKSDEMYVGAKRRIHEGRAMAVVRADGEIGKITLNVSAEGIPAVSVEIGVK
jgi:beta-galactosidase